MSQVRTALIVDDERDIRELLVLTLGRMGLRVETAANLTSAEELLARNKYDLCLTDMRLPDGSGQTLIELISNRYQETPVAMITAHGNIDAAVAALKAGAFDFISKPVDLNALRRLVQSALQLGEQRRAQQQLSANKLMGDSAPMQRLREMIAKVARNQAPVSILGESGTGKELVARLIHDLGPRAEGPFVPVNCGAIPTELMESEFFGHKRGSFTGAHIDKEGLFQAAQGGTLFLDEVAELPLHMQVKLLRVIQEKSVRPVGANSEVPIDVRILSATHHNLAQLVQKGQFRHDLYYRINVIELRVPPLRERGEDVIQLATSILRRLARESGIPRFTLDEEAANALRGYSFPGNIRELENILERAVALCEGGVIRGEDLRLPSMGNHGFLTPPSREASDPGSSPAETPAVAATSSASSPQSKRVPVEPLPNYIEQLEREVITKALEECRYNKTKTAEKLGITFRALRYKLKKLSIE